MGWVETWRTRIRVYWRVYSRCQSMSVDLRPNHHGRYDAWFCTRLPFHRGQHRDERYAHAVWDR